ncbi:omega-amidase, chloroplastic-like isoform X1 [Cucurbita maxima]|uniref:Omega-amidase, chloroplastic-like isoform X1 n=1 Tax=Cucurbita maxima TaxID=3661 RepID=A0A6J1INW9_CUCMA|nr:omega-amidase, chloroplastic-like isoform X1 [Cucurbita maxima]XP_022977054.1 omega-amidase, chloroplastic-like isoform X1 [Cucurbita maxima]
MKAAISSLISFRNFDLHEPSLSRSIFRQLSLLLPSQFPVISTDAKVYGANFTNLHQKFRFHSIKTSPIMASSFNPERATSPPAVPPPVPPVTKFKIGLCQLMATPDKQRNIEHARKAIEEAVGKGAKLVVLPEIWNVPYSPDSVSLYAEDIEAGGEASPSTAMLSEVSRRLKVTIVGGSIVERSGDKIYNTCCVFGTDGNMKAKHRKIHLFDIDIPGKITFIESKAVAAGQTPTVVDTEVGRIGIGICYDIRFPELAMIYAARGAHLICCPGAFNMTTGPLHWELLQRARAVDNLLYVATCSRARGVDDSYVAWGHSTLVGPFGEVLATTEHDEAIIISEIDYSLIELRRTNLPLLKQKRGDLYQLVDVQRLKSE